MTTDELTNNVADGLLPDGDSYWDKQPNELKNIVFKFTGILSNFLNNRLGAAAELDKETARAIWHEAFKCGWIGDYSLLPPVTGDDAKFKLTNDDLALVTSRDLYEHLGKFFPDASESNPEYETIDTNINKGIRFSDKFYVPKYVIQNNEKFELRLLNIAMHHMWLDVLEDKIEHVPYAVARQCIYHGHVDLLRHLLDNNIVKITNLKHFYSKIDHKNNTIYRLFDYAASYGRLDVLKLLHESGCTGVTTDAMNRAAENGHLPVVKWLHANRSEGCSTYAMNSAAQNGHLDTVMWLHANRNEGCTTDAMDWAAKNGHLDTVMWLNENRNVGCTTLAIVGAAENGHLDVVKWLDRNRTEGCTSVAIDKAAANGHTEIVRYLLTNRIEGFTYHAMNNASANGHVEVVRLLLSHITNFNYVTVDHAAANGHVEIVRLMLDGKFTATTDGIDKAAANGHTKVVRLLLERSHNFTANALKECKSDEIAKMLVNSMDHKARKDMLMSMIKDDCEGVGFNQLLKSFTK